MFYDRFTESVRQFPDLIAVELQRESSAVATGVPPVESYTFTQLRDMAAAVGNWLLTSNLTKGSKCAFLAANHPLWMAAYLGVLASGNTAVPLDTAFHADQVRKLLLDSDAVLLFCDRQRLAIAREAAHDLPVRLVLLDGRDPIDSLPLLADILAAVPANFQPVPVAADDIAMILYTSGTTSDPKGVMLSHGNLDAEAEGVFQVIDVGPKDGILGILPLFHSLAQMANIMLPLSAGMRVVYLESMNTSELLRALQERGITVFACVPQFFYLIFERIQKEVQQKGALVRSLFRAMMALSAFSRKFGVNLGKLFFGRVHHMLGKRMRYLVTGGSRFDPAVGRQFQALGFTLLQRYGIGWQAPAQQRNENLRRRTLSRARRSRRRRNRLSRRHHYGRLLQAPRSHRRHVSRRMAVQRRPRLLRCRRQLLHHRTQERCHRPQQRQEHLSRGNRSPLSAVAQHQGSVRDRPGRRGDRGRALLRASARRHRSRLRSAAPRQNRQYRRHAALRNRGSLGQDSFHQARSQLRDLAERAAPHQHPQDQALRSRAARQARRRHASRGRRPA